MWDTSRQGYETSFRVHILPELGKYRLDEITKPKMEEFVSKLLRKRTHGQNGKGDQKQKVRTLSKHTIRLILAALGRLYSRAIDHGLVTRNPTRGLGKFYRYAPVRHEEILPLNPEEAVQFLEAVSEYAPQHYALFLCALHTGMRSGELAALQWDDIDWKTKYVTVRRNYVSGRITSTKTAKIRRVDLSNAVLVALSELRRQRQREWLKKGQNEIPEWIFCNREGKLTDMKNLKRRHFKRVLRKAGLRNMRFHDLRYVLSLIML